MSLLTILGWMGVADIFFHGDPIKRALRFAARRVQDVPTRFFIGAVYGNIELYGYTGVGFMIYSELKGAIQRWQTPKSVTPVMQKSEALRKNVQSAKSNLQNWMKRSQQSNERSL